MLIIILLSVVLILLALNVAKKIFKKKKSAADQSIMIVFGSGGHTTEMLLMLETIKLQEYRHVHFVVAETDTWSMTKIQNHFQTQMKLPVDLNQAKNLTKWRLKRAREIKQSYFTSVFITITALLHSLYVCAVAQPDLVISNGYVTAVPLFIANILLGFLQVLL